MENGLRSLERDLAEHESRIATVYGLLEERDRQIAELGSETVRRGEWALGLNQQLKLAQAQLTQMNSSNSWRITFPLREVRRWISTPKQQAKRYFRVSLRLAKRMYQSLPLSYQTKTAHRNALAKYLPKILLESGSHSATIPVLNLPIMKRAILEKFANPADFAKTIEIPTSQHPQVSIIIPDLR